MERDDLHWCWWKRLDVTWNSRRVLKERMREKKWVNERRKIEREIWNILMKKKVAKRKIWRILCKLHILQLSHHHLHFVLSPSSLSLYLFLSPSQSFPSLKVQSCNVEWVGLGRHPDSLTHIFVSSLWLTYCNQTGFFLSFCLSFFHILSLFLSYSLFLLYSLSFFSTLRLTLNKRSHPNPKLLDDQQNQQKSSVCIIQLRRKLLREKIQEMK